MDQLHLRDLWGIVIAVGLFLALLNREALGDLMRSIAARYWPHLTSSREEQDTASPVVATPETPVNNNTQNEPQLIAMGNNERNALLFAGKADALAAMVHAGKIGETEGIKLVFGVGPSSTNKTYQAAREMLKARLVRLQPKRELTPEQEALRVGLGLSNGNNG